MKNVHGSEIDQLHQQETLRKEVRGREVLNELFFDPKADIGGRDAESPFYVQPDSFLLGLLEDALSIGYPFSLSYREFNEMDTSKIQFSELGTHISKVGRGRTFFDLGAGYNPVGRILAQLIGCKRFVGVDLCYEKPIDIQLGEFPQFSPDFESVYVRADIKKFLQNLKPPDTGALCLLSAIQVDYRKMSDANADAYIRQVLVDIQRIEEYGGGVILGAMLDGRFDSIFNLSFDLVATQKDKLNGGDKKHGLRLFVKK